jgi:hypothetical protein
LDLLGASKDEPTEGIDDPTPDDPPDTPPLELEPELELPESPPPRDTAEPPPSPPREVDSPVVLPFDERCAAAVVGNPIRPATATERAKVRANLCFITPPTSETRRMSDPTSKQQICQSGAIEFRPVPRILLPIDFACCPIPSAPRHRLETAPMSISRRPPAPCPASDLDKLTF